MRQLLPFLFLWLLSLPLSAQMEGIRLFGGPQNDEGFSVLPVGDNGFIVLATTRSYGAGSSDIYSFRINLSGQVLWERTLGEEHHDIAARLEYGHNGDLVICGTTWDLGPGRMDVFLGGIGIDGTPTFQKGIGVWSHDDRGFSAKPTPDGGHIVMGYSRSGGPSGDFMLIKMAANGMREWRTFYGTMYPDFGHDVLVEPDGYLMVGTANGYYSHTHTFNRSNQSDILLVKADLDGQELWRKTLGGNQHEFVWRILEAQGGGYYVLGSTQSSGAGNFDIYLLHLDQNGDELWSKTFGGPDLDYGYGLSQASDGSLYLTGATISFSSNENPDIYVIKTDSEGNELWDKTFGDVGSDYAYDIRALDDGGCILTGSVERSFLDKDIALLRLDQDGVPLALDTLPAPNLFTLYPNPMGDFTVIQSDGVNSYKLRIFDALGRLILRDEMDGDSYLLSGRALSSGVYFYEVLNADKRVHIGRFVKK